CARQASAHDEISAMPMGYGTLIGDMGTVLSGGQKQRLLIARALYTQPAVLLLDEATSHLDLAREKDVSAAIRAQQVTRIIVAHTLASALGINPYVYGLGDNRITIPFLKAFANPALYPGDPLIAERPFYYTYLWNGLGLLHARLGLDLRALFLGTYLAALFLTFLALYRLSLALFRNRASAMVALVLVAFSRRTLGGIPTTEEMLTTRAVATPIALFALL